MVKSCGKSGKELRRREGGASHNWQVPKYPGTYPASPHLLESLPLFHSYRRQEEEKEQSPESQAKTHGRVDSCLPSAFWHLRLPVSPSLPHRSPSSYLPPPPPSPVTFTTEDSSQSIARKDTDAILHPPWSVQSTRSPPSLCLLSLFPSYAKAASQPLDSNRDDAGTAAEPESAFAVIHSTCTHSIPNRHLTCAAHSPTQLLQSRQLPGSVPGLALALVRPNAFSTTPLLLPCLFFASPFLWIDHVLTLNNRGPSNDNPRWNKLFVVKCLLPSPHTWASVLPD